MLFSEPKIPQTRRVAVKRRIRRSFSALQRAENSSKLAVRAVASATGEVSVLFSEPKIPQTREVTAMLQPHFGFSALQRAENSSKRLTSSTTPVCACFSALQRAENSSNVAEKTPRLRIVGFSALQRAENSSKRRDRGEAATNGRVSVLFSEPKIPQKSA